MTSGSPARWMAPLALVAAFLAVVFVVRGSPQDTPDRPAPPSTQSSTDKADESGSTTPQTSTTPPTDDARTTSTTPASGEETYTVQPGDTLGTIAEQTGVSVEELQELNPDVDSQALSVGDKIRLVR